MGWARSYCRKCSNGLAAATVEEVIADAQQCPNCDTFDEPNRTRDDVLLDLAQEVAELKEKINGTHH